LEARLIPPTLLYISFHYPFGGGSGSHRTARLARHLLAAGWDVTVLCGPPPAEVASNPAFSFRLVSVRGILHRRAATPLPHGSPPDPPRPDRPSRLRLLLRQAAFIPDSEIFWIPYAFGAARRALHGRPADAILCSGPPFSVFILGRALKLIWGAPLILDYRDVWQGHPWWPAPRWRRRPEAWLERRLLAGADLVVANHDPMLKSLLTGAPRIADRCLLIPNGFDPDELGPPVRPLWRSGETFEIVYAGTLYRPVPAPDGRSEALSVQRPVGFFRALRHLLERGVFGPGGVRVTFVGAKDGTDERANLTECARECGVADSMQVLSRMEKHAVVPIMRRAHLLLNFLYYTEAQVAQKVYDYLHLEIPILSLFRGSEANASIVRRAGAGPIVDPADTPAIVSAIEAILRDYRAGRSPIASDRTFIDQFAARSQTRQLDSCLRALVAARPSAAEERDGC
jgi:glycosyltransferase involved in cell wall biosynthesis